MKKIKLHLTLLLMVFAVTISAQESYITDVVFHELDAVNKKTKSVVFAGKSYRYDLDVEKSSYTFAADAKTAVNLSALKVGEKYHFEVMAKGDDIKSQNYKYVTFISKSKPSE